MMRGPKFLAVVLVLALLTFSPGCVNQTGGKSSTSTTTQQVQWKPDGLINPGEYRANFSSGDGTFQAFFRVENGTLFVGMRARTHGWLAVGFGGSGGMKNTDIVIAYVLPNGTVRISDSYSTGFAGPHNPDTVLGGSFDIISYGGREDENWTVVEFSRKLDTGDNYDFKIPADGSFRVIWAYGLVDDFLSMHVSAGSTFVSLGGG
ncbi:DOMON domain-containing protein [Thermococcus sp.]|uniref:DOMON domain-containing protein n=1 Tax=Thermococcus sp. TaxID=35749 RepID=UPI0026384441|nr:DOMON domain-containing protein [Thermococcus sp.]